MSELAAEQTRGWTAAAMMTRVVRYADLQPCYNAFIDSRSPGSEAKENFTIIGPGVSENPDQHVHIAEPHGFNIGGARQPPGCINSQHSHDTSEIFVVHSGDWQINIGETGDDAHLFIAPGDVVSVPTHLFRGFTNAGDTTGFLWVVLGGDDPGRVMWAPYVFDMAHDHGLILLEDGSLIDTQAGQHAPPGARPMPRTSAEQVAALSIPDAAALDAIVWRAAGCSSGSGTTPLIGPNAPLTADHGIKMSRIDLGADDHLDMAAACAPRVLFVHDGAVDIAWHDERMTLGQGDTITVPMGLDHVLMTKSGATLYHVGA
jgi:mannose-6-phosphate isomerase-like protein (cupin superfamily)